MVATGAAYISMRLEVVIECTVNEGIKQLSLDPPAVALPSCPSNSICMPSDATRGLATRKNEEKNLYILVGIITCPHRGREIAGLLESRHSPVLTSPKPRFRAQPAAIIAGEYYANGKKDLHYAHKLMHPDLHHDFLSRKVAVLPTSAQCEVVGVASVSPVVLEASVQAFAAPSPLVV